MFFWDEYERLQTGQAERKKKFLKIGEDVFSFLWIKPPMLALKKEKDNGKCPVK